MDLKSQDLKFALIVCTYQRPQSLKCLLNSVSVQKNKPDQILIIDGSPGTDTKDMLSAYNLISLEYYKVSEEERGLTRQRNYGISKVLHDIEIICFLDDDIVLQPQYFKDLIRTYYFFPNAVGVGGYISEEINWKKTFSKPRYDEYKFDGWVRKLGSRNLLRKKFSLLSDTPPGVMPEFSHGLSVSFLPPSGEIYPVEFFMGGVSSFKKELFKSIHFSEYFLDYGLYEDLDFCLRASKIGALYVNTKAYLFHFHAEEGRPNMLKYGKMVMRNGWYVWRLKHPTPSLKAIFKWHAIGFLLMIVRIGNAFSTKNRIASLQEGLGRVIGWFSLFFNKPKIERS